MRNNVFLNYIDNNRKIFLVLSIFLIIGICCGIHAVNNAKTEQKNEIQKYVFETINSIKNNESIDKPNLLKKSLKKNIAIVGGIGFLGCTILGSFLIYIVVLCKGFTIGYALAAFLACLGTKTGTVFNLAGLTLQNLLLISAVMIVAQSSLCLYKKVKKCNFVNIKYEVTLHLFIVVIAIIIAILTSFCEAYISTNFLLFLKEIF